MKCIDVPCSVEIEQTAENFYAHAIADGIEINPGDQVLVHGAPCRVEFGDRISLRCTATIARANIFERSWARFTSFLEFTALYEVGFERREST